MKLLGLDINSGDQNHISLSNGHFFNQENEYKQYALTILDRLSGNDPGYFAQALSFYTQLKEDIEVNAPTENDQILEKLKVIDQFAESKIQDVDFLSGLVCPLCWVRC